jgi:hypothetical protein
VGDGSEAALPIIKKKVNSNWVEEYSSSVAMMNDELRDEGFSLCLSPSSSSSDHGSVFNRHYQKNHGYSQQRVGAVTASQGG